MKKQLMKLGLIGALLLLVPAQSWAIPVNIEIKHNNFGTIIHESATGSGPFKKIYRLNGTLWGELTKVFKRNGRFKGYSLAGINGTLTTGANGPEVKISSGSIFDHKSTASDKHAKGRINYEITSGMYSGTGTFTFANNVSANKLWRKSSNPDMWGLKLWGGDEPNEIGMDLYAWITPKPPMSAPEPATFILFGTGLAGLGLLRYRKNRLEK